MLCSMSVRDMNFSEHHYILFQREVCGLSCFFCPAVRLAVGEPEIWGADGNETVAGTDVPSMATDGDDADEVGIGGIDRADKNEKRADKDTKTRDIELGADVVGVVTAAGSLPAKMQFSA